MLMRVPEATCPGDATGDRFDSSSKFESTTKLWRLWPWLLQPAVHQVNLPFSYYYRSKGTSLPHQLATGDEEPYDMRETLFVRSPDRMEEAQVVPFHLLLHHHPHLHRRNRKERQAYSLLQTTMEPLPHGLWSCPSKPLTGRTGLQTEGRFSRSTGTTGDTPCWIQDYSHYRTRTRHNSRRHASLATPLRLHISCRNNDKPTGSSLLATNLAGDRLLRIAHLDTNICPIPPPS